MSLQRKIQRAQAKAAAKTRKADGFVSSSEHTDKIIDHLESSSSVASYVWSVVRKLQEMTKRLVPPMGICIPIVHVEAQEWFDHLKIKDVESRVYAQGGYLAGNPITVADLYEEAHFLRDQIRSETAIGSRARPDKQSTAVVFHKDGSAEFFYFELATGMSGVVAEEVSHGDDTSVNFSLRPGHDQLGALHLPADGEVQRGCGPGDDEGDRVLDLGPQLARHQDRLLQVVGDVGHADELRFQALLDDRLASFAPQHGGAPVVVHAAGQHRAGGEHDHVLAEHTGKIPRLAHCPYLSSSHRFTTAVHDHLSRILARLSRYFSATLG